MTEVVNHMDVQDSPALQDAYAELVRMDAQYHADELNRSGGVGTPSGADGDDSFSGLGRDSTDDSSQKQAGRDQVLKFLQDNEDAMPGGAELFKGQQQQISRLGQENAEFNNRMEALEKRFDPEAEESADPELALREKRLSRWKPEQKQMVQDLLEAEGYVKQSVLDDEKAEERAQDYTTTSVQSGIDTHGDRFGSMVDGRFVWNDRIAEQVKTEFARLTSDETGIVPMDLFWIVEGPQYAAELARLQKQTNLDGNRSRVRRSFNGGTVRQSGSSASSVRNIRQKGDLDATVDRAILESLQEANA